MATTSCRNILRFADGQCGSVTDAITRLDMTKNPGNAESIQRVLLKVQMDASASTISASVVEHSFCHESSSIGIIPVLRDYYPRQGQHRDQETGHDKPISEPRIDSQFVAQRNR